MNSKTKTENIISVMTLSIGQLISKIPYEYRPIIGNIYKKRIKEISLTQNENLLKEYIYNNIYKLVKYAVGNVPFYKEYYEQNNFNLEKLKTYNDIQYIPIINKSILLKNDLNNITSRVKSKYKVNTGGSSGRTLSFYIQPSSIGHEWAHMHTIWKRLGFSQKDLRLSFIGRNNITSGVKYDLLRHSVLIDIYKQFREISDPLKELLRKHPVKYFHGYPSAIYEFALYCSEEDIELRDLIRKSIKGVLLGSEYPLQLYRDTIENVFNTDSISWYGHTERCILAYEKHEKYRYYPFQTYGYAEAIKFGNSDDYHLIGTSYYNYASPLIRYDTEDLVNDILYENNIMKSFRIDEGRSGQYILDSQNKKISLTGLIFGRHHALFNYCTNIQVYQKDKGKAVILYVLKEKTKKIDPSLLFDSSNVNVIFSFKQIIEPIKTITGKTNILINDNQYASNNTKF